VSPSRRNEDAPPWIYPSKGSPGEVELARCQGPVVTSYRSGANLTPLRGYSAPHNGSVASDEGGNQLGLRTNPLVYTPLVLPLSPRQTSDRDTTTYIGLVVDKKLNWI